MQSPRPFKTYVINLDEDVERLTHMRAQLSAAGLSFERAPGVKGAEAPQELRPWFFDAAGRLVSPMRPGEIGCDAAHLSVHRRIAAGEAGPVALILEDDIRFSPDLGDVCEVALARMPPGWDILRLSSAAKRTYVPLADLPGAAKLIRYSRVPNSAAAYLLSEAGARKLSRPGPRMHVIDEYLRRPWLAGLHTYGVTPVPVIDNVFASSIDALSPRSVGRENYRVTGGVLLQGAANLPRRLAWNVAALGPLRWSACAAINGLDKFTRKLTGKTIIHVSAAMLGA